MITKKNVEHIARLSRIELAGHDEEKLEKDLAGILDFVNKLNEVDTAGVEPLAGGLAKRSPADLEGATRKDEAVLPLGNPAELVNSAPQKKDGWVETRAIFKEPK
ncbi:MAG: Asp-tRNA(Asn)/Glu-tRNA(Gln) amidotransferase subunit GatC [Candidatus Sungiibacteriota bacterium]